MLEKVEISITIEMAKCVCPFCGKPEIDDVTNLMNELTNHVQYECDNFPPQRNVSLPGHKCDIIARGEDGRVWAVLHEDDYDLVVMTAIMPISLSEVKEVFEDEIARLERQINVTQFHQMRAEELFQFQEAGK